MKKFTYHDHGHRGELPPALVPYIGARDRGAATREFIGVMEAIARDYHARIDADTMTWDDISRVKLNTPKIFGQDTTIDYIASGTAATVYRVQIGDVVVALKINRMGRAVASDLESMHLYKRARHLINRVYIGATFDVDGVGYSWTISQYVDRDRANGFDAAREKVFLAHLTKGLSYSDMSPNNTKDGKIIDHSGLHRRAPELTRAQVDRVRKLIHYMQVGNRDAFADMVSRDPVVLKYLFIHMNLMRFEMPERFAPYLDIVKSFYRMENPIALSHGGHGRD